MSHPQGIQQYEYAYPSAPPQRPWEPREPYRPWDSWEYGGQGYGGPEYERDPYDTYRPSYELHGDPYGAYEGLGAYGPPGAPPLPEPPAYHPEPPEPPEGSEAFDPVLWLPRQPTGGSGDVPAHVPAPARPGGRAAARRAARERKAAQRPEALRRLLPQALVVAFLAGGTCAFVVDDKAVSLSVEGEDGPRTLHTFADDVSELLADEGVSVGAHDAVSPAPGEPLSHGDSVTVRYGRPLTLTLDGRPRRVWTTAATVEAALRGIGVRPEGARVSVPRDRRIGRDGMALTVWTERSVTVLADGREHTVRTSAATVRGALADAGVELRGADRASVDPDSFPRDGQTVTVLRITETERVRDEPIPYTTERRGDPALLRGTEVVEQTGLPGLRRLTYEVRTVNGVRQRPRLTGTAVVRAPRPQIVRVGTAEPPSSVRGADGLDWEALARCESGGRPDAVGPGGHGGLYQFDTRTWRSLGGKGRPQDAPPAEQTYRAKKLYVQKGASPWPVCGRKLHR
ncbi:ubiquitin-like domain-containing protein [Streptomyces sp. S1A]|uniref:ubiquitin-like domain-containing protein n=1 Tax=Streptomyces sp. ICN903 TaxID=2964654 RepID=UPI001ED9D9CF|nr:ubiquitin-like domain-containing protein [Streptomyces sp. ICN903]MCG3044342.1 ubiquitin-like domain-containing protein [Streptomyces sp. ICN903]